MESLESYINSIWFTVENDGKRTTARDSLSNLKAKLESAKATTTFWGSRVVEIDGYSGSVYLDDIAEKINRAFQNLFLSVPSYIVTDQERMDGIAIVHEVVDFYKITDEEIKNSNFFTRILNWIREVLFYNSLYDCRLAFEKNELEMLLQKQSPKARTLV